MIDNIQNEQDTKMIRQNTGEQITSYDMDGIRHIRTFEKI